MRDSTRGCNRHERGLVSWACAQGFICKPAGRELHEQSIIMRSDILLQQYLKPGVRGSGPDLQGRGPGLNLVTISRGSQPDFPG
jgi:hypothetical protein